MLQINTILGILGGTLGTVIDKAIPDKNQSQKMKYEMQMALMQDISKINVAQTETNKQEAQHRTVFVAGWRPFVGWTCGIALAWHFVVAPFIIFLSAYIGVELPENMPTFDMESLLTVLMGMLGLGGLRTFEKFKGVAK